ncbi:Methyltransferase-like protein 13 [Seminavis robusta]|uniref:Methyltransferase-like protein 13 n=1 Tax=Seminavis robusta TaxID=568900 RepID=A0A9N8HVX0_9STRA|nr:Methyltransferase-like protein 13 [Seminavis robusta]|eukprot:Sro2446_g327950.1 Methyltransferase-like protein 13 (279) ;mRNA; r:7270-8106
MVFPIIFAFVAPSRLQQQSHANPKPPTAIIVEDSVRRLPCSALSTSSEPSDSSSSRFGRQDYWDSFYQEEDGAAFSWYTGWADLEPFLMELLNPDDTILLPGVGSDTMLLDMYESGYRHLTAFDYAAQGIARCREMMGSERSNAIHLFVGDARDLPQLEDASFDVVLEKGTLDAIVQSGEGGTLKEKKALGLENMEKAIAELCRVIKPGGTFISISAICTEELENSPEWQRTTTGDDDAVWAMIRDGSLYFTESGYASNNFDGTLLAWRKKKRSQEEE